MPTRATDMDPVELIATEADIRSAYRLLLDREPDPAGKATFLELVRAENTSPSRIAELIMASAEYRNSARREMDNVAVELDIEGIRYTVFPRRGDLLIGANLLDGGTYEPYVMGHFVRALSGGACFLDVGANIGIYSLLAARKVGARGRVIAVEPLPQNHRALYAGIIGNRLDNVEVLPVAASSRNGLVSIQCAADSSNGIVNDAARQGDPATHVPAQRLDAFYLGMPRLDVIKIDIEGHEPMAWDGLRPLAERFRPVIFTEFSPVAISNHGQATAKDYLRMLFEYCPVIKVLHRDVDPVDCSGIDQLMEQHEMANRRAGYDGVLHLDLYLEPKR